MKVLRQSLFARRDYEGLSDEGVKFLADKRKEEAKKLRLERKNLKRVLEDVERDISKNTEKKIKGSLISDKGNLEEVLKEKSDNIKRIRKKFFKESYSKPLQDSKDAAKRFKEEALRLKNTSSTAPVTDSRSNNILKKVKGVVTDKRLLIPSAVIATGVAGKVIYDDHKKRKQIDNSRKYILGKDIK